MEAAGGVPETLIFVDVDGVLNVGIRDAGSKPIQLEERGCAYAESQRHDGGGGGQKLDYLVEKVLEVMRRPVEGDEAGSTLRAHASCTGELCCDLLVARLAEVISAAAVAAAAGAGTLRVVLSSNWRRPKHAKLVRGFEQNLSRLLGRPFVFDAATKLVEEVAAADRLRCIGDFLQEERGAAAVTLAVPSELKVLVLDDFFVTPMSGWECDGTAIRSVLDAEAYLRSRAPSAAKISVKILHPYEEWRSRGGLRVQVGIGLNPQHCRQAAAFLGSASAAAAAAPQQQHEDDDNMDSTNLDSDTEDTDSWGCC